MKFFIVLFSVFAITSGWKIVNPFDHFSPPINVTNINVDSKSLNSSNFTNSENTEKYFNMSDFADIDLVTLCSVTGSNSTNFTDSNTIEPSLTVSNYTDYPIHKSSNVTFNITEVCTFFNAVNLNITDISIDEPVSNPPECNAYNCDYLLPIMNWNNLTMIVWPSTEQDALEYCNNWAKYGLCLEKYLTAEKNDCIRRDMVIEDDELSMSLVQKYHNLVCFNSSTMVSFLDRAACYLHLSVLEDIFTARYQWKAMSSWDQICATLWFIESIKASMDRNCEVSVAESYQAMVDVLIVTANKATGIVRTYKACRAKLAGPSQKFLDFITGVTDHRILFKFGEVGMKVLRYSAAQALHYNPFSFERSGDVNKSEHQKKSRASWYTTMLLWKVSNNLP